MNRNLVTYLLSISFILLLFVKDIGASLPQLFNRSFAESSMQSDWPEEESNNKIPEIAKTGNTEYLDKIHNYVLSIPVISIRNRKQLPENDSFKQSFYGTVLTPPPDLF